MSKRMNCVMCPSERREEERGGGGDSFLRSSFPYYISILSILVYDISCGLALSNCCIRPFPIPHSPLPSRAGASMLILVSMASRVTII